MNKIKYTEMFYSFQGEGLHIGKPSVFFRTFGCNLTCRGFGQSSPYLPIEDMPHNKFDVSQIKNINELPIFDVGCDSSAAWSSKYKHLAVTEEVDTIGLKLSTLDKVIRWGQDTHNPRVHLVITGGEPLLKGWQKAYPSLFASPHLRFLKDVTFETNGTQVLNCEMKTWLRNIDRPNVTWSISPKLSISGEHYDTAINIEAIKSIKTFLRSNDHFYLKFVVRDENCIPEVFNVINHYEKHNINISDNIYLMPEGATKDGLSITSEKVAELALKYGFSYSPRLHVDVFGNKWGT